MKLPEKIADQLTPLRVIVAVAVGLFIAGWTLKDKIVLAEDLQPLQLAQDKQQGDIEFIYNKNHAALIREAGWLERQKHLTPVEQRRLEQLRQEIRDYEDLKAQRK
jgi:hypothetical protein